MVSVCLPFDALFQHLPSYLGFSYLGCGVSPHRCPSWPWTWNSSSRPSCALLLFIIGDWNAKVGSEEISGVTGKFGLGVQNEAGQRLIEFCQQNAVVIANSLFQQHKRKLHMDITRWSIQKSDWLYSSQQKMEKLYPVSKNKTGSWLRLRSWTRYCQIQT